MLQPTLQLSLLTKRKITIGITQILTQQIIPVGLNHTKQNQSTTHVRQVGGFQMADTPVAGSRLDKDGTLNDVGYSGNYWSASPRVDNAYYFYLTGDGKANPSDDYHRAYGRSVRCIQE